MNSFWRTVFATIVGLFLYGILMWIIWVLFLVNISLLTKASKPQLLHNSVLVLKLDRPIQDKLTLKPDILQLLNPQNRPLGLNQIIKSIQHASTDPKIKGILIDTRFLLADWAQVEEIRNALKDFKSTGKFIIAFSDIYMNKNYYLSTVADKIYVVPTGAVQWQGLTTEMLFFKKLLDKLGVKPVLIRHGKFKTAAEPFVREQISKPNKEQIQLLLNRIWSQILSATSQHTGLSNEKLNKLADQVSIKVTSDAVKYGLVDAQLYYDQLLDTLKQLLGTQSKVNFISLSQYYQTFEKVKPAIASNQIAVVYAQGQIVDMKTSTSATEIVGRKFAKLLRKLRNDNHVKAIVLRVNSPGGSALASEEIWREVYLTAQQKPLIVSMGGVAASGGYYISCAANKIVADSMTITGSIGVFGLLFDARDLTENKLGITHSVIKTNNNNIVNPLFSGMTPELKQFVQIQIDTIYQTFVSRVAQGRNLPQEFVDSIAQGRVWSAVDAKRLNLVDTLGDLQLAINLAIEESGVSEVQIVEYPKAKTFLDLLLNPDYTLNSLFKPHFNSQIYRQLQYVENLTKQSKIYALFPYKLEIY